MAKDYYQDGIRLPMKGDEDVDPCCNMTAAQVEAAIEKWSKEAGEQFAKTMAESLKPVVEGMIGLVNKHTKKQKCSTCSHEIMTPGYCDYCAMPLKNGDKKQ